MSAAEVLIVEDDTAVREQMAELLQKEGFQVRQAEHGLAGLRAIREGIPDLLISDLAMPVMDGIELVEEMVLEYPMLPIMVLSDGRTMSEVAKMLRLGVKDFVFKPVRNKKAFLHSVKSILKENDSAYQDGDFCQQWFNVSDVSDKSFTKELRWHLDELNHSPVLARELLLGLMPEQSSKQGIWQLSYHVLQSADISPIVFDYAWLQGGKLAFYILDSASGDSHALPTVLLIRAFFNAFLRTSSHEPKALQHLVQKISHSIKNVDYACQVKALFGLADVTREQLELISAGLSVKFKINEKITIFGESENALGIKNHYGKHHLFELKKMEIDLSLNDLTQRSFVLKIRQF